MSRWCIIAAVCVLGAGAHAAELVDDEDDENVPARLLKEQREETLQKMTTEERAAWQERRWARLERRLERLRTRNKSGRITTEEKAELERLEEFKRHHTKLVLKPLNAPSEPGEKKNTLPFRR